MNRLDLPSQIIQVRLKVISEIDRVPENDLWEEFNCFIPEILGTWLDGVSAALRHLSSTRLENAPPIILGKLISEKIPAMLQQRRKLVPDDLEKLPLPTD